MRLGGSSPRAYQTIDGWRCCVTCSTPLVAREHDPDCYCDEYDDTAGKYLPRTYAVTRTLGCQMNEHDSERMAGLLECDLIPVDTVPGRRRATDAGGMGAERYRHQRLGA